MNFLAHLLLSGNDSSIKFGNFVADSMKGNSYLTLPLQVQKGILLHRNIDTFTDQHQLIRDCKKLISNEINHYRGVVIDVFFDHFLTVNWEKYSETSLNDFLHQFESIYYENQNLLDENIRLFFNKFLEKKFLYDYATIEGVERTLLGLQFRIKNRVPLANAISDFKKNYNSLQKAFQDFFPEIQQFCQSKLLSD